MCSAWVSWNYNVHCFAVIRYSQLPELTCSRPGFPSQKDLLFDMTLNTISNNQAKQLYHPRLWFTRNAWRVNKCVYCIVLYCIQIYVQVTFCNTGAACRQLWLAMPWTRWRIVAIGPAVQRQQSIRAASTWDRVDLAAVNQLRLGHDRLLHRQVRQATSRWWLGVCSRIAVTASGVIRRELVAVAYDSGGPSQAAQYRGLLKWISWPSNVDTRLSINVWE